MKNKDLLYRPCDYMIGSNDWGKRELPPVIDYIERKSNGRSLSLGKKNFGPREVAEEKVREFDKYGV